MYATRSKVSPGSLLVGIIAYRYSPVYHVAIAIIYSRWLIDNISME